MVEKDLNRLRGSIKSGLKMRASDKARILLVDDRPDKLVALQSVLSEMQNEVVVVSSGADALRELLRQEFAVILLDVNMPGMSGFETAARIRQRKALEHLPIIFVAARDTTQEEVLQGYSLGAVDYLPTPLVPEVIRAKVSVFVELHKKNKEIQRARDQLKESNEALETFSYTVAHDLRAPLRAMQGFSKALVEDYAARLDASGRQFLDFIASSATHMDRLIQDLLNYSKLSQHQLELKSTPLQAIVTECLQQLAVDIERQHAQVQVDDSLPSVIGHPEALKHVLLNLLSNALKYVRAGTRPKIRVHSEEREGNVRLWVHDNGIGISPEHRERVFRIFERLHGDAYPGTGVGLAIVQKSVERMGGTFGVESEPNQGSHFWFELPLADFSELSAP